MQALSKLTELHAHHSRAPKVEAGTAEEQGGDRGEDSQTRDKA